MRDGAGASHRQCGRPADGPGFRIEGPEAHQGMDDDDVGAGLQDLERRSRRCHPYESLHQAAKAAALLLGLLEQRFADPALRAGGEVVQRDERRPRGALPVYEQRAALWQHASRDYAGEAESARVEEHRPRHGIEDERQAGFRRFHQQRAFDHVHTVDRQAAELRFLPGDLAAIDVHGRERAVRGDEERAGRGGLLPADVAAEVDGPRGDASRRSLSRRSLKEQGKNRQSHECPPERPPYPPVAPRGARG